jgi:hypothetical protein
MGAVAQRELTVTAKLGDGRAATEIRGTVLCNGLAIVREQGRERSYLDALPQSWHEQVLSLVASSWLPMDLAVAHFFAMDAAFPDAREQRENGKTGAVRSQNAYVATVVRGLRAAGVDYVPLGLTRVPSVVARQVCGGTCTVYRAGTKDARIELSGYPFLAAKYCHHAWQGMFESSLGVLSKRIFVRNDLGFATHERMALLLSWV